MAYSTFVESLRRLYVNKSPAVTKEYLQNLIKSGKITQADYEYIISG